MSTAQLQALASVLDAATRLGLITEADEWEDVEEKLDAVREEEAKL